MPTPRKNSRKKQTKGKKRKQTATLGVVWVAAWVACGVFVVLIAGLIIRQTIFIVEPEPVPQIEPVHEPEPEIAAEATQPSEPVLEEDTAPEMKPPSAADKEPKRTLPKTLYVGFDEGMYPSVHEALADSISGDVIEIQTNRPVFLEPFLLVSKDSDEPTRLQLKAGKGFSPVVRCTGRIAMRLRNVNLQVQGIHFVTNFPTTPIHFFIIHSGVLSTDSCSFTCLSDPQFLGSVVQVTGRIDGVLLQINHCVMRNIGAIQVWQPKGGDVEISGIVNHCLVGGGYFIECHYRDQLPQIAEVQGVRVNIKASQCTLILAVLWASYQSGDQILPMTVSLDRSIVMSRILLRSPEPERFYWRDRASKDAHWNSSNNAISIKSGGQLSSIFSFPDPKTRVAVHDSDKQKTLKQFAANFGSGQELGSFLAPSMVADKYNPRKTVNMLPSDFKIDPRSSQWLQPLTKRGIKVGADTSQLPIPPPITLQPYSKG